MVTQVWWTARGAVQVLAWWLLARGHEDLYQLVQVSVSVGDVVVNALRSSHYSAPRL